MKKIRIKKKPPQPRKSLNRHPNSHAREVALQALYQLEVVHHPLPEVTEFRWLNNPLTDEEHALTLQLIEGVAELEEKIDAVIDAYIHKDASQISAIVRSILRMGTFEILKGAFDIRILIDDYCTLTRRYDGDPSVGFVHGTLDHIYQDHRAIREGEDGEKSTDV